MFVHPRVAACLAVVLAACSTPGDDGPAGPSAVDELSASMEGSFRSAAQAARDPKHFLDVELSMTRIFADRDDGPWLYVEQAVATSLERPFRQRVFRLVANDDGPGVECDVYTLPGDPLAFAGAGRDPAKLADLAPDQLVLRAGCEVLFQRVNADAWHGLTHGRACASNLANASYATADVTITPDMLKVWDRGFDASDRQVWGAVEGPYEFVRVVARE